MFVYMHFIFVCERGADIFHLALFKKFLFIELCNLTKIL